MGGDKRTMASHHDTNGPYKYSDERERETEERDSFTSHPTSPNASSSLQISANLLPPTLSLALALALAR